MLNASWYLLWLPTILVATSPTDSNISQSINLPQVQYVTAHDSVELQNILPDYDNSIVGIYEVDRNGTFHSFSTATKTSKIPATQDFVLTFKANQAGECGSPPIQFLIQVGSLLLYGNADFSLRDGKLLKMSDESLCKPLFQCVFGQLERSYSVFKPTSNYEGANLGASAQFGPDVLDLQLCDCIGSLTNEDLLCSMKRMAKENLHSDDCPDNSDFASQRSWNQWSVDDNLQTFIVGGFDKWNKNGPDRERIWWPGIYQILRHFDASNTTSMHYITHHRPVGFVAAIGAQMLGNANFQCGLKNQCSPNLLCDSVGSSIAVLNEAGIFPLTWPYLALTALTNIDQQLKNQYGALTIAAVKNTLGSFDANVFYPPTKTHFNILNIIQGLSSTFGILAGFAPGIPSVTLASSSAAIGAVGAYLGRYISNTTDPNAPQEKFAASILAIYNNLLAGLDLLTTSLFNGDTINGGATNGGFNITDMMRGGAWIDRSALRNVTDIEEQTTIEILSRVIDSLWKTPSHNKIFVTFVDLNDTADSITNCRSDYSGPYPFKYCADGGVYYTYNFIEGGPGTGWLGWPWGADKMKGLFKIDPSWVTEASAKTYRAAKASNLSNPFDITNNASTLFTQAFLTDASLNLDSFAGRSATSWTLPVCDMSTWGAKWNRDYTHDTSVSQRQLVPCLCGPGGQETKDWVAAAGMKDFDTYHSTCKTQLTQKNLGFQWPDGVDSVDFGFGDVIHMPK